MSDEGDRACPLCAEEMDLTDQQLKPCKCGYEICVWCWHHIMDMAEKDHSQGRCPACRTPYNKEKIVGTTAKCERLMAEMNMEKKTKSQRTKSKSDGRKQLGSVRVIQKSLVYIVGLPLTLADENLLQHGDFFGQYGKVMKVSISRTAAGSIQQFANDSCSVYITYTKEEDAVRCIQSVHGFILDGRPLRACFGTTKYCHAWLRNVPCNNSGCLYLHETGIEEDSFSKDEIISAYTRVQHITGAPSNMQRRSGNVLPPPADESNISTSALSGKPTSKSPSNNILTRVNSSLPNGSSAQSAALPLAASWGARRSNGNPPSSNIAGSNGPSKVKSEENSGPVSSIAATFQVPRLDAETKRKQTDNEESQKKPHEGGQEPMKSRSRQHSCTDSKTANEAPVEIHSPPSPKGEGRYTRIELVDTISTQGNNDTMCSNSELDITTNLGADHSCINRLNSSPSRNFANSSVDKEVKRSYQEELKDSSTPISRSKSTGSGDDSWFPEGQSDLRPEFDTIQSETESHLQTFTSKIDSQVTGPILRQHLESLEEKKFDISEFDTGTSYFSAPSSLHHSNLSRAHSPKRTDYYGSNGFIVDPPTSDNNVDNGMLRHSSGISAVVNGYRGNLVNNHDYLGRNFEHDCIKDNLVGRSEVAAANAEESVATDMGESSIISNILSMDLDPWEESLTSPHNLVKLLGEGDMRQGPPAPSNSWKAQSSNKSRFSFARPNEYRELSSRVEPSFGHMQQMFKESPLSHDFGVNKYFNSDKFRDCNGFSTFNNEEPDNLNGSYSYISSNKFSGSRSQISAPPGFSTPNKAAPPGFTSHDRMEPNFDSFSGNHLLDASSLLRNRSQSPQTGIIGSDMDIEFMDPAILAVGKGRLPIGLNNGVGLDMRYDFSPQLKAVENEARFQSLMQRDSPPLQNMRYSGMGNGYGAISDTHHNHLSSRVLEQNLASNVSAFSQLGLQQPRTSINPNFQWNSWSEGMSANDMGIAELLRTESHGFNKFYGGYEDPQFHMPNSGVYNRTYGI